MAPCTFPTQTGSACPNQASTLHRGEYCCGIHKRSMVTREMCVICLDIIGKRPFVNLDCDHVYHKTCLGDWEKPNCPQCRSNMSPDLCLDVYWKSKLRPLLYEMYSGVRPDSIPVAYKVLEKVGASAAMQQLFG